MGEVNDSIFSFSLPEIDQIKRFIPKAKVNDFLKRAAVAIEIYQELDEPKLVQMELREIGRLTKKVNYTLVNVITNSNPTTKQFLERFSPLPTLPDVENEEDLNQYAKDIRRRISKGLILKNEVVYSLPTGASKIGRPRSERIDILVSFIAAAYVLATGNTIRRKWDIDETLPMHDILIVIFENLGINASVDEAIRRLLG